MRSVILLGDTGWAVRRVACRHNMGCDRRYATIDNTRYTLAPTGPGEDGLARFRIPWDPRMPRPTGAFRLAPRSHLPERTPPAMTQPIPLEVAPGARFTIAVQGDRPVPLDVMRAAVRYVDEQTVTADACAATLVPVEGGWALETKLRLPAPAEFLTITVNTAGAQ